MVRVLMLTAFLISQPALAEVSVSDAWVRLLPPVVKTTAAYMTLTSSEQDILLSASSSQVERVEIHRSSMANGVMSMAQVEKVELESGQSLELSPGGYHLMLIGLKRPLKEGEKFPLKLTFTNSGELEIELPVKR